MRQALIDLCYAQGFRTVTIEQLCRRAGLDPTDLNARYRRPRGLLSFRFTVASLSATVVRPPRPRTGLSEWRAGVRATAYGLYC